MVSRAFQRGDGTLEGEVRARWEQRGRWIEADRAKIDALKPFRTPEQKRAREGYQLRIQHYEYERDLLRQCMAGAGLDMEGDER